ncbi:MAG: DNA gyrase subunit A [Deltaproteobacteria bacterium]|nr:MAG: DNA gyrase subunit A [Deltaproteobacteria bacterium]
MAENPSSLVPVAIEDEMRQAYLDYSMSVIVGRALPDVRDGLKPVHRRILYAMFEQGMLHNRRYSKCAGTVGEVLKKYHPHGDAAVYDALVRLAQEWNMRAPLIDGQGNFGSIDGDSAAAYRYTEARLTKLAEQMLADIDKETVDFGPNFDDSTTEPLVLPARFPNLLVNGSAGIAVGMATNIPPHNLGEVIASTIHLVDHPDAPLRDLLDTKLGGTLPGGIQGPDFPTGGLLMGLGPIRALYETGRAVLRLRAKVEIETHEKTGRDSIVVTEVPYQVNKARSIQSIADLVKDKKLEGISDLRDESSREGIRAVVETKRDAVTGVVLNNLYQHSALFQDSFGATMLAIDRGQPRTLGLKPLLERFIAHRRDVVTRRTRYDLRKAREREHILLGYKIALDHIDEIIAVIKASPNRETASNQLQLLYQLSEIQAKAILEMQLQRLTGLEKQKIVDELAEVQKLITQLSAILGSEQLLLDVIKTELREVQRDFSDPRRTEIVGEASDLSTEDLIADEDMVVTVSHAGYVKRNPVSLYRAQKRGGKGKTGAASVEDDFIEQIFVASTHAYLLLFTNKGRVFWLKVHELPQAGRAARGKAIVNLVQLAPEEKIAALLTVKELPRKGLVEADDTETPAEGVAPVAPAEDAESGGEVETPLTPEEQARKAADDAIQIGKGPYILFVTRNGLVKRTALHAFSRPRPSGLKALSIEENDSLVSVMLARGDEDVVMGTRTGMAIRFEQKEVRSMGRTAYGVKGITLEEGDQVVGAELLRGGSTILTLTENGYGKRTALEDYRRTHRGGKGIIDIKTSDRNGSVVAMVQTTDADELMIITNKGMIIRTRVAEISVIGRNTQGVRLIDLRQEGEKVVGATRAPEEREADAAAAVLQETETPGGEDDDGSPPSGEET